MKPKTRKRTIIGYVWPDAVLGYQPFLDYWIEVAGERRSSMVKAKITFEWEDAQHSEQVAARAIQEKP